MPALAPTPTAYSKISDLDSDEDREDFLAFLRSSSPSAEQIERFNRPEFSVLMIDLGGSALVSLPDVEIVEWHGDFSVADFARIEVPYLQKIRGFLGVFNRATVFAPSLLSVGGVIMAFDGADIHAAKLSEAAGGVVVMESGALFAPLLDNG